MRTAYGINSSFLNISELVMARVCQITGKSPMVGNNVSHANNKTKTSFFCLTCSHAASGWKAKTALSACVWALLLCAPLIKMALKLC